VKELLIIGFAEKHRALEVLSQLQGLPGEWSEDLQNAVAVEVERGGGLKLFHGLLLECETSMDDATVWKGILSAILPPPYWAGGSSSSPAQLDLNSEFIRDAAALLRPGNSVLLAIIHDSKAMLPVVSRYSRFILHTQLEWRRGR
jgi:uncharacterized membrane protein